jgi:sarcosine oxidase subunit beta
VRYSAFSLLRHALSGHRNWQAAWRDAEPKSRYDIIVIGGGGHGLATAYYLAKEHGVSKVAVLEKGWIGGGNTGRNTTVIRSNYFYPESAAFYDFSVKLYEGLGRDFNYNVMFSQRGMINMAVTRHDVEMLRRSYNAMQLNGIDCEWLEPEEVYRRAPLLNRPPAARFEIRAGLNQPRAGTARHDAVAWGYARGASDRGVDIVQNCEVTGFIRQDGRVVGVTTNRGEIRADRVCLAVAGHTSQLGALAGLRLPITSYALQAMVSEPVKPVLDTVLLFAATGVYVSQTDKGELVFGSALDLYPSYAQRGNFQTVEHTVAGLLEMFPAFSRLRLMRQWAGIVDVVKDSTPIMGLTPVPGLFINAGWGTGGFKAIPAGGFTMAHTLVHDKPHPLIEAFGLKRFETGALIDEASAAGIAH